MRTKLALAGGTLALTTSLTVVVTGLATAPQSGGPFGLASAAAEELVPFEDCEELLAWYVEEALPHVGPYGFDSPYGWEGPILLDGDVFRSDAMESGSADTAGSGTAVPVAGSPQPSTSAPDAGVSSDDSGTNVQEVGVDEPDRAKTDGDRVVHLRNHTLVVTDVTGDEPEEVGTLRLPRQLGSPELLLAGDTVLVLGTTGGYGMPIPADVMVDRMMPVQPQPESSRLLEVSLTDPAAPTVVSDRTFGGSLVSARLYTEDDATVRLVLSTGHPTLDFVQPNRDRTEKEAEKLNRQIVRESDIDDWLPSLRVDEGERAPLVACSDVRHPTTGAGFGTLTVVTLPATDPTGLTSTAVTAAGDTVYSSTDRLYLATRTDGTGSEVHSFALDGATTSYVASGEVDGVIRDRWSMDEHDGVLRVAVAHGQEWSPEENGITTLREEDGDLVEVGSVRGLGPDEQIKSVRWFDDLAIVVTFREVDPLYTVDLSDPARPRTLGELKIPGFSEYLHPVGGDRIVGVGQDASMQGRTRGGQVSLFDVADLASPERLGTLGLGRHARPAAGYDPRAFTWLPGDEAGSGTALTAVSDDWTGRATLVEVEVDEDGGLSEGRRWNLGLWTAEQGRALPLGDGRVAVVGADVELVDAG
jgi:hypothetical protein